MERLKAMKERLMSCVEEQMSNLSNANAHELGEAVDMIKDLEETIYYCTVVKAMEDKEDNKNKEIMYYPVMYTDGNNGSRYYGDRYYPSSSRMYYSAYDRGMRDYENVYPRNVMRDYREGRSGEYRRTYMESKEMHEGKEKQMHELEKYLQELNGDIMDMVNDASPEEKQILSQKLQTLAEKIK